MPGDTAFCNASPVPIRPVRRELFKFALRAARILASVLRNEQTELSNFLREYLPSALLCYTHKSSLSALSRISGSRLVRGMLIHADE